jgi:hypothetical protein
MIVEEYNTSPEYSKQQIYEIIKRVGEMVSPKDEAKILSCYCLQCKRIIV